MKRTLPPKLAKHDLNESAIEFYLALRSNYHQLDEVETYWDLYSSLYPGMDEEDFWNDLEALTKSLPSDIQEKNGELKVRSWEKGFCEIDTYAFNQLSTRAKIVYFYVFDLLSYNYVISFDLKAMVKTLGFYDLMDLINEVNSKMKRVVVIDPDQQVIATSIPIMGKLKSGEELDAFRETVKDVPSWRAFSLWRSLARDNSYKFFLTSRIKSLNSRAKQLGNNKDAKMIEQYLKRLIDNQRPTKSGRNANETATKFFNPLKISTLTDTIYKDKDKNKSSIETDDFSSGKKVGSDVTIPPKKNLDTSGQPAAEIESFFKYLDKQEIKDTLKHKNRSESYEDILEMVSEIWGKRPPFALRAEPSSEDVWIRHKEEKEFTKFKYRVVNYIYAIVRNLEDLPDTEVVGNDVDKFIQRLEEGWISLDGKRYKDEPDAARKFDAKQVKNMVMEKKIGDLGALADKIITFGKQKKSIDGVLCVTDILKTLT